MPGGLVTPSARWYQNVDRLPLPAGQAEHLRRRERGQDGARPSVDQHGSFALSLRQGAVVQDDSSADALPAAGLNLTPYRLLAPTTRLQILGGGNRFVCIVEHPG